VKAQPRTDADDARMYRLSENPHVRGILVRFGEDLRRCRHHVGMSQQTLEDRSGVDQTLISRLERGIATWSGIVHVVRIHDALGRAFPLGICPHEHACAWQRPGTRVPTWPVGEPWSAERGPGDPWPGDRGPGGSEEADDGAAS
jgi:transcriptional regulator with XRE-family HTH domain